MFLWKCRDNYNESTGECEHIEDIVVPYESPDKMSRFSNAVCSKCFDKYKTKDSEDWPVEHRISHRNGMRVQCDQDEMMFECRHPNQLGHIRLCSISQLKNYNNYPMKLFTVRAKGKIDIAKYGLIHVNQLSPSTLLFKKYNERWKKALFTDEEIKSINAIENGTWFDLYKPLYKKELEDKETIVFLEKIEEALNKGVDVLLICFCKDRCKCHLSVISDYFKAIKYKVVDS